MELIGPANDKFTPEEMSVLATHMRAFIEIREILSGSYSDRGMVYWFRRERKTLGDMSPLAYIKHFRLSGWSVVKDLAESLKETHGT